MTPKQAKNNQRLAARYAKLNSGKKMTLEEFQIGFKEFCRSLMSKSNK